MYHKEHVSRKTSTGMCIDLNDSQFERRETTKLPAYSPKGSNAASAGVGSSHGCPFGIDSIRSSSCFVALNLDSRYETPSVRVVLQVTGGAHRELLQREATSHSFPALQQNGSSS